MPRQPSTLFESHTKEQPFTLVHEHEAWHVTFPGHRCELDVKGSRIEAQAIARCYHSLFLVPGAPFAYADMSECEQLDLAEREAAIEIEVQARHATTIFRLSSSSTRAALPPGDLPVYQRLQWLQLSKQNPEIPNKKRSATKALLRSPRLMQNP